MIWVLWRGDGGHESTLSTGQGEAIRALNKHLFTGGRPAGCAGPLLGNTEVTSQVPALDAETSQAHVQRRPPETAHVVQAKGSEERSGHEG